MLSFFVVANNSGLHWLFSDELARRFLSEPGDQTPSSREKKW